MIGRRHLVIFVKAPMLGRVKSRLARDIGPAAACAVYRHILDRLLRRVARDPRWRTWLAVTPDRCARSGRFFPPDLTRVAQGRGDLGARMMRVFARLPPGPKLIVGSDIPAIDAAAVETGFRALASHDAVFGPAADGGYWALGVNRAPGPRALAGVRWSSRHALADSRARFTGWRIGLLDEYEDIDDIAALERWRTGASGGSGADV